MGTRRRRRRLPTVGSAAMSLVGAIQDGVSRDYSTLAVKAVLDCVIIAIITASLGKGCIFSAIPVFVLEGAVTLLAQLLAPADGAGGLYLSLIGFILIFCVGSISSRAVSCGSPIFSGHPLCHRVFLSPLALLIRGDTPAKQKIWRTVAVHQIFCFYPFYFGSAFNARPAFDTTAGAGPRGTPDE
ncbi:MAG: DUF554 family protein [Oscillospiraceae bacterium]